VTDYNDISRKMNCNRNRQFGRLIGAILSQYVQFHSTGKLAVYCTARDRLGSGTNPTGAAEFLVYIFYF